jgi:hypothetical protein
MFLLLVFMGFIRLRQNTPVQLLDTGLKERGVVFTTEPAQAGEVTRAVFDDTCGNLVTLVQVG